MRLGLVANPSSGRGRHNGAADAARRALLGAGHDVLLVEGAHYEDARACATGLLEDARGLDALVVVGGDGVDGFRGALRGRVRREREDGL